jgi:trehalose-6-phosphate synthase
LVRLKWSNCHAWHDGDTAVVDNKIIYVTIDLSREDHKEYYPAFANRILWL